MHDEMARLEHFRWSMVCCFATHDIKWSMVCCFATHDIKELLEGMDIIFDVFGSGANNGSYDLRAILVDNIM
jgi:hypothetical protein